MGRVAAIEMTNTFRIVKRAYSKYETVETFTGSFCDASNRAHEIQFEKSDGEYIVRRTDEPNYIRGSSYQSGMDWL